MPADAPQIFFYTRGAGVNINFSLYDGAAAVFKTGAALGAGNTLIGGDNGALVNTTNNGAEYAATGVYRLVLTSAETYFHNIYIKVTKAGTIADKLLYGYGELPATIPSLILNAGISQGPGSSTNTILLDPSTVSSTITSDCFVGGTIILYPQEMSVGSGDDQQYRTITAFNVATLEATVDTDWTRAPTTPPVSTPYAILPGVNVSISAANVWNQSEGAQPAGAIPDNATFGQIMQYVKRRFYSNVTQTATTQTVFQDDSTTPLTSMATSYDGVTQTKGKGV